MRLGRIPPERFGPVLAFDRLKLGGGAAFVMMVQPTDFTNFDHLTFGGRLSSSEERGVFAERQMSAPVVVVGNIRRESMIQRALSEDDDVIQAFAANGTNAPFHIGPLPGRSRRRKHLFNAHGLHLIDEVLPEDSITIAQ
jgi:hypothetical protein